MKPSREEVLKIAEECFADPHYGFVLTENIERFAAAMYEAGAAECGKLLAEQDSEYNRKTNAMITRHSNQLAAERAVSDKLLEALREYDRLIGYQYSGSRPAMTALANAAQNGARAIAEVEAMRKES